MAEGGEVYVLDMGQPIRIYDMARTMIHLSGLTVRDEENPEGDIEVQEVGLRKGEKLFEELVFDDSEVAPTRNPKILRTKHTPVDFNAIRASMETLGLLVLEGKVDEARKVLFDFAADHG